jgi:rhodanese-related sulfurtransferase
MFTAFVVILPILALLLFRSFIFPLFYTKEIRQELVNNNDYCTIDVRDYSVFHRTPTEQAKNIPLSILHRSVNEEDCDKEIVVVSDDTKGALMAARILNKAKKKPIYYYTV